MGDSHKLHNRDRLSELPDSLIITILSFLQMNDAVRTSVLSKRWIDRSQIQPSFLLHHPSISRSGFVAALRHWKAGGAGFVGWLTTTRRRPPQRLYSCSSIRKLNLSGIELENPWKRAAESTHEFDGNELEIGERRDPASLWRSGAMEIGENYNIRSESLKKLRIGTHNSMYARIDFRSALRIWAPNLSTLEIGGYVNDGFSLDVHVPSLTTAILGFDESYHHQVNFEDLPLLGMFDQVFRSIRHAQSVTLSKLCIKLLLHLKKKGMSVEFSNAKYLKIYPSEPVGEMVVPVLELLGVVEMFPKLLTWAIVYYCMSTKDVDSFSASENKIDIPLRHLKTCEMTLSAANSSILRVVEAVLENGEMLENMVLRLRNDNALGSGALEKVLSMRRSSPKARVIISKYTT